MSQKKAAPAQVNPVMIKLYNAIQKKINAIEDDDEYKSRVQNFYEQIKQKKETSEVRKGKLESFLPYIDSKNEADMEQLLLYGGSRKANRRSAKNKRNKKRKRTHGKRKTSRI